MANLPAVFPALRWVFGLALTLGAATIATGAVSSELTEQLVSALNSAADEEAATQIIEPHIGDLKKLDSKVVEKVVLRQFWGLANIMVAKSHEQQVDLSFAVRKAVRTLKDEADELLRTLNPKYGEAQQVAPAFQWAQNDTCIFLTVKFTIRWNAPGALEVTEPAMVLDKNNMNFTGFGKHSNNKYKYQLALSLFDNLAPAASTWTLASVGKLSVTLKKRWARKWPRLLANKKTKIGNMHVWMDNQEKLDASLGGMATASNSPVTCAASDKLYCLATDTCKKSANCSQCPGKTVALEEAHMCTGMPTEKASLSFKDLDMDEHEIGGPISITKARNEFDIDHYAVFWGKDDKSKLEIDDKPGLIGEAAPTGSDTEVVLKQNTKVPEQATHILVFSKNAYGEYPTPGHVIVRDAYLPREKPKRIVFHDEFGEKGEVSGTVTVSRASDEATFEEYSLHWGKSATRKIASSSFLKDIPKGAAMEAKDDPEVYAVTHYLSRSTTVPDGATHLIVFSKNSHGEHHSPASVKVVDNLKACLNATNDDCPLGVTAKGSDPEVFSVQRAIMEASVTHYVLYFGTRACESVEGSSGAKNGHISDLPVDGSADYELPADLTVPAGTTHVLAFSKNRYGESDVCVSTSFVQKTGSEKKEL